MTKHQKECSGKNVFGLDATWGVELGWRGPDIASFSEGFVGLGEFLRVDQDLSEKECSGKSLLGLDAPWGVEIVWRGPDIASFSESFVRLGEFLSVDQDLSDPSFERPCTVGKVGNVLGLAEQDLRDPCFGRLKVVWLVRNVLGFSDQDLSDPYFERLGIVGLVREVLGFPAGLIRNVFVRVIENLNERTSLRGLRGLNEMVLLGNSRHRFK